MGILTKYPITVWVLQLYQNTLEPQQFQGRYEKAMFQTSQNAIESRYLCIKKGLFGKETKIPWFPQQSFELVDTKQRLWLLQIDINNYLPMIFENGVMKTVSYIQRPQFDKQGKPLMIPVLDAAGKPEHDEKGKPITQQAVETVAMEHPIFNSKVMLKDGQLVQVPYLLAIDAYESQEWLSQEYYKTTMLYDIKPWWQQNSALIVAIILGISLIAVAWLMGGALTQAATLFVNGMKEAAISTAPRIIQATATPIANAPPFG